MNKALQLAAKELNIFIPEFTVAGEPSGTFFGHHWYVGTKDPVDEKLLAEMIDENLKKLNDDYAVERKHALKTVEVTVLPEERFLAFLHAKGKEGAQHKFPRVLKGAQLAEWQSFLKTGQVN